jgi:acetyl esterase/lipase
MYAPGGTFRRESWDQLTKGGRVPPGVDKKTGVRSRDVAVPARHAASVPVRIFESPDAGRAQPILLWMHGGGFSLGSAADKFTHQLCAELCARLGMSVVSVDYRLAPEHPFPAAWQDCYDVLRWLACDARGAVAGDADRIVVGGDSAGANLALFLAGLARDGLDGDLQPTSARIHVCHQVLLYPALFLPTFVRSKNVFDNNRERAVMENLFLPQPTRNFFLLSTFGSFARLEELHRKDRRVAPLLAKTADLPPTVVRSPRHRLCSVLADQD